MFVAEWVGDHPSVFGVAVDPVCCHPLVGGGDKGGAVSTGCGEYLGELAACAVVIGVVAALLA